MKTNILVSVRNVLLILVLASVMPVFAFAQTAATDDIASSVTAGQQTWQQLQDKRVSCGSLSDTNFENLGEYFMDRMMGSSHEAMNEYIVSRFGESGEEQMHITMGKRLSGCDTQAVYPTGFRGFMPMMGGYGGSMMGYESDYYGSDYARSMMGYGYGSMMGYGGLGFLFDILWWVLVVVAVVALVRWLSGRPGVWGSTGALDTLKERYAKGEIDREEFESKKKDIMG